MSGEPEQPVPVPVYDVCVVGAGPSGATCAYYLAQRGKRVLLLEKKTFPRDKLCGDAVCTNAQIHLDRMGVLRELEEEGTGHWAAVGGLVSPRRIGFIGNSAKQNGRPLVMAVKRMILDEKIARAAQRAGALLVENTTVTGASLSRAEGVWTVQATRNGAAVSYRARALVAADGALSRLTQALGIPTPPPDSVCSRAYIKAGTHQFDMDGVVFYELDMVPGYCALFREAGGDVNYCVYIIPGGRCSIDDLYEMHHRILRDNPYVRRAVGPHAVIDKMKGAPLRLGGIRKSYHDHLLIVGDAAGHIDPLTGEGIHHAMDGGYLAAEVLCEALAVGDLSERFLRRYQDRWMRAFGRDFFWSKKMAQVFAKAPILVDASAAVMQRKGADSLLEWGRVMTGVAPKRYFLRPEVALPLLVETGRQVVRQALGKIVPDVRVSLDGVVRPWMP
ncbi:MAG: geranylgeranyl reductase family protein [Myxococcales bacterium]|nr:geranylgeranyl reductase family protein [Myxococcota bacterium]MDW8282016.1 geranylgeranyl reductase family protein [Myxococcales bacterium]